MQHIGMHIRKLRKEKKLTLQQLAGDRLTKGMLSLIENGKAQPSMESLHYIAQQLDVPVSVLVEGETPTHIVDVLKKVEHAVASYNYLPTEQEREALRVNEIASLAPLVETLSFTTFEEVEIYYYYAAYFTLAYSEEKEAKLRDVMKYYERLNAASHVVRCYFRIMEMYFTQCDYETGYAIMQEAEQYVDAHAFHVDVMRKIDVYYYVVVLASALGKQDVTATYTDKILAICKEHRLYYETNELYRIRFSESLTVDKEQAYYFLQKMEQFATFTEDATEQSLAQLMRISYVIHVQKDYDAALMLANSVAYSDVPFYREIVEHSIQGIKGMLHYYKGQYDVALTYLEQFTVRDMMPYPLDLCSDYMKLAMKGACYIALGRIEDGKKEIVYAHEQTKPFISNIYKDKIESLYTEYVSTKRSAQ